MDIKKIFYDGIVPEAAIGRIDVYQFYNVIFKTNICGNDAADDNIFIPTLMIKNKEIFDKLLMEYVNVAMSFYDNSNFPVEILDYKMYDDKKMICKEKAIMAMLFANATTDDFNEPILFLTKRINFMYNHFNDKRELGYSDILKSKLDLEIKKDIINNETPSEMIITASDNDYSFVFPKVKFGISDDTVYIYAIQNGKNNDNDFVKKINRRLYKVGEGFVSEDTSENLKDITASFLVSLNIAINYFKMLGYRKFVVPSLLIERWNAKRMAINLKYNKGKISLGERDELALRQEMIQSNLTNKLIRTFLRLACHYNNIDVIAFPYDIDACLHLTINDGVNVNCNNALLWETGNLVNVNNKSKI